MSCVGGGDADRIVIHSHDCGDGESPANLDLAVLDPDKVYVHDLDGINLVYVHHVRVRHHGPTDSDRPGIPPDFVEAEDVTED